MRPVASYLPGTRIPALLGAIFLYVLFCLVEGILWLVRDVIDRHSWMSLFGVAFWFALAVGLWRLHPFARKVAVSMLWVFVVMILFFLFDLYMPIVPNRGLPRPWQLAAALTVVVACLYQFSRHKAEFGKRGGA